MTDTSKLDVLAVKHWRKKAKGEVGENLKLFLGVSPYGKLKMTTCLLALSVPVPMFQGPLLPLLGSQKAAADG